jgi:hypothetical protein
MKDSSKFSIVPVDWMDELMQKVDKLTEALLKSNSQGMEPLGGYITEAEAKHLLSKGTTWFWNMKKAGKLKGRKAGNRWYYKKSDLLAFIENDTA